MNAIDRVTMNIRVDESQHACIFVCRVARADEAVAFYQHAIRCEKGGNLLTFVNDLGARPVRGHNSATNNSKVRYKRARSR